VVVGGLIGSGASQEQAIVGETSNLAARLQGIAEPNSIVMAESTRKLVGNLFELEDLGAQDLKGVAGRCKLGLRCDRPQLKAASRPCTRAACRDQMLSGMWRLAVLSRH
jgi:class 3 adenylate cyclase